MSLEKEVFPFMAQDGDLFAFNLEGELWWERREGGVEGGGDGDGGREKRVWLFEL